MEKRRIRCLTDLLTASVVFLAVCDVLITASAPWWLRHTYSGRIGGLRYIVGYSYNPLGTTYPPLLAFFVLSGLFALGILAAAYRILGRICKSRPFCLENAKSMRRAALCGVCLCVLFLAKLLFLPSIWTFVNAGIFLLCSLFLLVLSALLREAVRLKEENDLTV